MAAARVRIIEVARSRLVLVIYAMAFLRPTLHLSRVPPGDLARSTTCLRDPGYGRTGSRLILVHEGLRRGCCVACRQASASMPIRSFTAISRQPETALLRFRQRSSSLMDGRPTGCSLVVRPAAQFLRGGSLRFCREPTDLGAKRGPAWAAGFRYDFSAGDQFVQPGTGLGSIGLLRTVHAGRDDQHAFLRGAIAG